MSYFILEKHKAYTPPIIKNWYGKMDMKKGSNMIPKHTTFPIANHMQTVFVDMLLHPCFMVSKKAMNVIKLYEPSLSYEHLALYDPENKKTKVYYIPRLPQLDVFTANSKFNQNKSVIIYAEVDGTKTYDKALFQASNMKNATILIHLELIESLLKHGVTCMGLKETTTIY